MGVGQWWPTQPIHGGREARFGGELPAALLKVEVFLVGCGTPPHNSSLRLELRRQELGEWRLVEWTGMRQ